MQCKRAGSIPKPEDGIREESGVEIFTLTPNLTELEQFY